MASGILGQSAPAATTNTTVYTVPVDRTSTFTITICNRDVVAATVRLAIAATGTPAVAEYLLYDSVLPASGSIEKSGVVAGVGENVVVYASSALTSVSVYGFEE
jgi:hypothetical protein